MLRDVLFVALALFGSQLPAQSVLMNQRFEDNTEYQVTTSSIVDQVLEVSGQLTPSTSKTITIVNVKHGQRSAGKIPVHHTLERLTANISMGGTPVLMFDSKNPKPPGNPALQTMFDGFKVRAQSNRTYVVDKKNRVVDVQFAEDFEIPLAFADQFDKKMMALQYQQQLNVVPSDVVTPGDTWDRKTVQQMGGGQTMAFTTRYEYAARMPPGRGGTAGLDIINSKIIEFDYKVDPKVSPFRLKSHDLKLAESRGDVHLDPKTGLVVATSQEVRIAGELELIAPGNMALQGSLDLKMSGSVKVTPKTADTTP